MILFWYSYTEFLDFSFLVFNFCQLNIYLQRFKENNLEIQHVI